MPSHFFISPEHYGNPFQDALEELQNTSEYQQQLERYQQQLRDPKKKQALTLLISGGIGAIGAAWGLLASQSVMGSLLSGFVSASAGSLTGTMAESLIKAFTDAPPLVKRHMYLLGHAIDFEVGPFTQLVKGLGEYRKDQFWKYDTIRLANGLTMKQTYESPAATLMLALISRYAYDHELLEEALPKMQGKVSDQRLLGELKSALRLLNQNPMKETKAVWNAVENMIHMCKTENQLLGSDINTREEAPRWLEHLRDVLPDVIRYLEDK